jgi:hypothetical protein
LAKYHANGGDERIPLVVFELAQIRHAIRMEEEISKSTSYLSLFATPGNRKRMKLILAVAVFSQWRCVLPPLFRLGIMLQSYLSGNGLVSYYINLVLEGVGVKDTESKVCITNSS